jgi:predicted metal-dependent enzyme (double-stranded beta helix superfamily)
MFEIETFIEDCKAAVRRDPTHKSVDDIARRAMSDPQAVMSAVGEPERGGLHAIYASPELTILNVVWKPEMVLMPHDHAMWAVIGIYTGREDNIFWRRLKDDPQGRIEAAGAKALAAGDVAPLGPDVIHSVTNPIPKLTGAIHIYGGDFFEAERLEWEAEGLPERRWDPEVAKARFAD